MNQTESRMFTSPMPGIGTVVFIVNQGTVRAAKVVEQKRTRVIIRWSNSVRTMERAVKFTESIPTWLASPNDTCISVMYMDGHIVNALRILAVTRYFAERGILPDYPLRVDATFLGWQEWVDGGRIALYNVNKPGHPLDKSTVSAKTLLANGLTFMEVKQ